MKKLLVLVLMVLFALTGCFDSDSGSSKNKCAGPVPCLATDWGSRYALFYDGDGDPVVLMSDGKNMEVSGFVEIDDETYIYTLAGAVRSCYSANTTVGGIDYDLDGIIDAIFISVTGNLSVCAETLRIYNIVVEGEAQEDIVAKFDSLASLSASNHLSTDAPISAENVEKVKIMIKLIEQLMEE